MSIEYVLRQEVRTLNIVNDSKAREITQLQNWVKRLQEEKSNSIAQIQELINTHKNSTGECDHSCDYVTAWEDAIEIIKEQG